VQRATQPERLREQMQVFQRGRLVVLALGSDVLVLEALEDLLGQLHT
jgi:hypothetical protein